MEFYKVRFDYLGLSTEEKPTDVVDGSTFYEVDTKILYLAYKNKWYNQND